MLRDVKNTAEKGLLAPFPSVYEGRLQRVLARLFPGKIFRVYRDKTPLFHEQIPLWRPFLDERAPFAPHIDDECAAVFSPVLPFPLSPEVLVIDKNAAGDFPASDMISPVILTGTVRALGDMLANPERGAFQFQKIRAALGEGASAGAQWRRQGIYLYKCENCPDYAAVFRRFLENGFLLPPTVDEPLILPGELSAGEEEKLAALLSAR
ncbi:MAG: hypothetical protein LBT01_04345 [Spirochaetaceae bacterium]|nr:hypothetical protein [Spirochaetaceae bacterium]